MQKFQRTWLWQSAFANNTEGYDSHELEFFRQLFLSMRANVAILVSRIAADLPGLTLHDISHLDALWETASLVANPHQPLTPPEAFVFGGACLLHDAGLTIAAFPGGLQELKNTTAWRDAAALAGFPFQRNAMAGIPPEIELRLTFDVLRAIHANKAAELALQEWKGPGGQSHFLIDNLEIRRFYGSTIGLIASSHWWSIKEVELNLNRYLGPLPPFTDSRVDLLKLACLLRVADALHLDRRRAPRFARVLHNPIGHSDLHWSFQEKLAFPILDGDAIKITSGEAFQLKDADAWWLSYDSIALADRELRDADLIMSEHRGSRLAANRVEGARDAGDLARLIRVDGWKPVDARVRVSDVTRVIEIFGGAKLYGNDLHVPVRELLQNALDAVQARRRLQERPADWGLISVRIDDRSDGAWFVVEDSGVGMSERVITGTLIDFGLSLWRSRVVIDEFPTLAARGMDAIGRFGIGFFSAFMLGDHIKVTTKRYDKSERDALVLEFSQGLASRPLLYPAPSGSAPLDGGTRIEIKLSKDPRSEGGILSQKLSDYYARAAYPLADLLCYLAPASDVTIHAVENGNAVVAVSAGDWLVMPAEELAARLVGPGFSKWKKIQIEALRLMRNIGSGDHVYGRATILPEYFRHGSTAALIVGGLRIEPLGELAGVIEGNVNRVDRRSGFISADEAALTEWATEQANLIEAMPSNQDKASCVEVILKLGGDIGELPIAFWQGHWLSTSALKQVLQELNEIKIDEVAPAYYADEPWSMEEYYHWEKVEKDMLLIWDKQTRLYQRQWDDPEPKPLLPYVMNLIHQAWGDLVEVDRHRGHFKRR